MLSSGKSEEYVANQAFTKRNEIKMFHQMRIVPFLNGSKYALELEEFWPDGGYGEFLKKFCAYIGATELDWCQGVESGIGQINFENQKLTLYWSDFPAVFSFDCNSFQQAERLRCLAGEYFNRQRADCRSGYKG